MTYQKPYYTQVPNLLLDEHMAIMGDAELRVVLAVVRQTFGYQKKAGKVSISELERLTGLSRQGVINGTNDAMERGVLWRRKSGQGYVYGLSLVNDVDQNQSTSLTSTSQRRLPEVVNDVDYIKERKKGFKENSSSSSGSPPQKQKQKPATESQAPNPFDTWHREAALTLTPHLAEVLGDLIADYGPHEVDTAIRIAVEAGKLNLRYVAGICQKRRNGDDRPRGNGGKDAPKAQWEIDMERSQAEQDAWLKEWMQTQEANGAG